MHLVNTALQLAELGYRVFPCTPGKKAPATAHGCLDATSDEDQIVAWWTENPEYNLGLSTDGLLVVDVDPLPDGAVNDFANDTDRLSDLLVSAGAKTPRGGSHFFFRQSAGMDLRNTAGKIALGVDTRANGGYVLVAPSVTDVGRYEWMHGFELDCRPEKLPPLPRWLMDLLLEDQSDCKESVGPLAVPGAIPDGQRNTTLTSMAGYLRRAGLSEDEIRAALRVANIQRCHPPLADAEVDKIAWSVSRYESDQTTQALVEGWAQQDAAAQQRELRDPGPFPMDLLQPGGFLGDVIAWNCTTAYKPQPELALAAALSLLSVLTGRKIADQTGTRTNLYVLGVCDSGGGKEHARKCNKSILQAAGLEKMIGPEGIGSHAGLHSSLRDNPAQLFQVDEFGRLLSTLNNPAKSPHLYAVVTVLLKLYTSSDALYKGDAVADVKRIATIDQPHCVLYGTTVPESFLQSMPKESLSDGFVGRLLMFEAANNDPDEREVDRGDAPAEIVAQARYWGDCKTCNPGGGNLQDVNPQPRTLRYSEAARGEFRALEITAKAEAKSGRETARLWTRCVEKARKLALLHQVSVDREATEISGFSAAWACRLAHYLTSRLEFVCGDWVAENQQEAMSKRVYRLIRSAGDAGMTLTQLTLKTRWLTARQRQEVLQSLEIGGEIVSGYANGGSRGPKPLAYCATRNGER